jgi:hypothetical protein
MPLRLLRILPASLAGPSLRKRGGGAKSRAVKVDDLRRACLQGDWSVKGKSSRQINDDLRAGDNSKVVEARCKRCKGTDSGAVGS